MPSKRFPGRARAGRGRTPVHPAFAFAMELCGPPGLDVRADVPLTQEHEIGMLLITPSLTPVLVADARRMGWRLVPIGDGHYRVEGAPFASYVALIDEVAEAEQDPVLAMFAHPPVSARLGPIPSDIRRKMMAYFEDMEVEALEDEELRELTRRFMSRFPVEMRLEGASPEAILAHLTLEERLAGLPPEERLAGLPPEERLAGLPPEERLAGLPPEERRAGLSVRSRCSSSRTRC